MPERTSPSYGGAATTDSVARGVVLALATTTAARRGHNKLAHRVCGLVALQVGPAMRSMAAPSSTTTATTATREPLPMLVALAAVEC